MLGTLSTSRRKHAFHFFFFFFTLNLETKANLEVLINKRRDDNEFLMTVKSVDLCMETYRESFVINASEFPPNNVNTRKIYMGIWLQAQCAHTEIQIAIAG